jgi:hypothetical protein
MAAPSKKYAKKKATIKASPSAEKKPATDDFHAADCAALYELFGVGNNQPAPSNLRIVQLIVQHRMLSELVANQQLATAAATPPKHKSGAEAFPTAPSKRVVREVPPATPWQPAPSQPAVRELNGNATPWLPASSKSTVMELNGNATPWQPAQSKPAVIELNANATPWQSAPSTLANGDHHSDSVAAPAPSKPVAMDLNGNATPWQPAPSKPAHGDYPSDSVAAPAPSKPAVMDITPDTAWQPAPVKPAAMGLNGNDRLGKRVNENSRVFRSCNQDWAQYVKSVRTRSHLHEDVGTVDHPAAKFLDHLRRDGVPIRMMDDNWTSEMLDERAARGSHQSTKAYTDFVREEMADFDEKSFWTVLPLDIAKQIPNLRLSPLGCVPQRDRRPRLINDLSFYAINQQTICMAPPDAMQFGRALERVLHKIKYADPRHGPVYLCKIDIADGFYRVDLEGASAPTLAVILPYKDGEEPLVAIPLSLPMGWVESPPYFCAVTETIADIANRDIHKRQAPHRLDDLADTAPPSISVPGTPTNYMLSVPLPADNSSRKQCVSQPINSETDPPMEHIPSVRLLTDSVSRKQRGSRPQTSATGPPTEHTPSVQLPTDNASRKQCGSCPQTPATGPSTEYTPSAQLPTDNTSRKQRGPRHAVILPYKDGEESLVTIPLSLPMGGVESPLPTTPATGTPTNYRPSVPQRPPTDNTSRKQRGPRHAVILPYKDGEESLVTIPLSLPNGGVDSPVPTTPATADIANRAIHTAQAPHRTPATEPPMNYTLLVPPTPNTSSRKQRGSGHQHTTDISRVRRRLAYIDIYVDDFLALCQGNKRERTRIRRVLLHAIDRILAPLDPEMHPQHNEPTSVKKLKKGDACWATTKVMLGWLIDTVAQTITLPPHRVKRLLEIFVSLRDKKRVSLKVWHRVIGELRSMVLAIPGGRGLFSALQHTLTHSEKNRIRITQDVRDALDDFELLGRSIAARPTRLSEIVPDQPTATGAHDASGTGAGGVWFTTTQNLVWRERFPVHIASQLVSSSNLKGALTNSDFEQAGGVWHHMLLANEEDIRGSTVHSLCDNTPAVSRFKKGSTTTKGAPAYLNRLLALHQRAHHYLSRHDYVPGPINAMADDASRRWDLDDQQLLTHFNQSYPQQLPWKLAHLPSQLVSPVIYSLQGIRSPMPLLPVPAPQPPPPPAGTNGHSFATTANSNLSPPMWSTPSLCPRSSPSNTGMALHHKAASQSELEPWLTSSETSARRWPFWGSPTLEAFQLANRTSA